VKSVKTAHILICILLHATTAVSQDVINPPHLVGQVVTPSDAFDAVLIAPYVIVPDYDAGIHVIDVTDPTDPFIVGSYDTPGYAVQCAVAGNTVYVADHRLGGMQIVRITNKATPGFVASYVTGDVAVMVAERDGVALLGYLEGTIDILDVSNPATPTRLATYDTPGAVRHAVFDGDLVYLADSGFGLLCIDISSPASPVAVGSAAGDRPIGAALRGDVAFLADGSGGLHSFDISNPSVPVSLDALLFSGPAVKVEITGHFAVLAAHVAGGLQVVDVTDPAGLVSVSSYVTGNYAHGVAVDGDYAYLADGEGLKVFRIFDSSVPVKRRTLGGIKSLFRTPTKE